MGEEESFFPYDYCFSYNNAHKHSKYYLPFLTTKIFLLSALNVLLSNLLVLLITHVALNLVFLVYLIKVRPFNSAFTNARVIIIDILVVVLNLAQGAYQYFALKDSYSELL